MGSLKTGGRKRGTPNRKTVELSETLGRLGHDIPTRITELLPQLPPEKQMDVYLQLMQYVYPKRKAIAHSVEVPSSLQPEMTSEERLARIRYLQNVLDDQVECVSFTKSDVRRD